MIYFDRLEGKNDNFYLYREADRVMYPDKNSLIKAIASMIGVSILTSDEVKNQVSGSIEKTDWDTEPITHDGIQFNRHFIDLKLKVLSLEAANVKLLERLAAVEDSKELAIDAIDGFVCDEKLNSIPPMYRRLLSFAKSISDAMKK